MKLVNYLLFASVQQTTARVSWFFCWPCSIAAVRVRRLFGVVVLSCKFRGLCREGSDFTDKFFFLLRRYRGRVGESANKILSTLDGARRQNRTTCYDAQHGCTHRTVIGPSCPFLYPPPFHFPAINPLPLLRLPPLPTPPPTSSTKTYPRQSSTVRPQLPRPWRSWQTLTKIPPQTQLVTMLVTRKFVTSI